MQVAKYSIQCVLLLILALTSVTHYSRVSLKSLKRASFEGLQRMEWYAEPGRKWIEIVARSSETAGKYMTYREFDRADAEGYYTELPGSLPKHSHPQLEIVEVLQGHVKYWLNGTAGEGFPGEKVTVPAGVPHLFWNGAAPEGQDLLLLTTLEPGHANGHDSAALFETLSGLSRTFDGPNGVNPVQVAGLLHEFGVQLADVPASVRPYVQATVHMVGRVLGYRWQYEEYTSAGGLTPFVPRQSRHLESEEDETHSEL